MRKLPKYFLLIISVCLIFTSLTACGKPSPASLGIEKPGSGGTIPVSSSIGLNVYGNGKIDTANKTAKIEIETSNLSKITVGYKVTLSIGKTGISYTGKVKSLPDSNAIGDSKKCTIVAAMDANGDLDSSENIEYDAKIKLPAKDGVWVVYRECIEDGSNGKKYVWVSKKIPEEIKANEEKWELTEVNTGESDGTLIEVTEGLKEFKTIFMPITTW